MKCPSCGHASDKVVDSRESREGEVIRRRRECLECGRRFTSYERIDEIPYMVVKKNGSRERFERQKLIAGMLKACEKRPVSVSALEAVADRLESTLQERSDREMSTAEIGEAVMQELKRLDKVAYVRFASVYRHFRDIGEFMTELKDLLRYAGLQAVPCGKRGLVEGQGFLHPGPHRLHDDPSRICHSDHTAKLFETVHKVKSVGTAVDEELYAKAKDFYEEAFYRQLFIGAENSVGFHNPPEALRILGDSVAFATKAEGYLRQLLTKAGVDVPIKVDLEIMKYVDQRGEKKLKFDPALEFKDPMGIQARF